jgi:murein DD-endopeptidase MepM/ murein hydrolase activator NlpD
MAVRRWVRQTLFSLFGLICLLGPLVLSGCVTSGAIPGDEGIHRQSGVYHKVKKGQTLWRIAQTYDVPISEIIAANRIPNAALLEEGQLILIPGREEIPQNTPVPIDDSDDREFSWPLQGRVVSCFGERSKGVSNKGIGISANDGVKVNASRGGRVVFADYLSGYAQTVILEHSGGFSSVYSYNEKLLVNLGDQVAKGQAIAEVGRKGVLHFEIRRNTVPENPLHYLPQI